MPRISKLGRYLSSRAASSTRLRVAGVAFPWPRRMRETVAIDSPVWRATTLSETAPSGAWNP